TVATLPKSSNDLFPPYTTLGPFPASTLSFIAVIESENPLDPYVQSWTLSVQRALAQNTTLEVNYIGTKSTHLLDRRNIAQPYQVPAESQAFSQATDPVPGASLNLDKAPSTIQVRCPIPTSPQSN